MKKYEQLNKIQRSQIQVLLKEKNSLQEIAKELSISRQTVYREIKRNSYTESRNVCGNNYSCKHYVECKRRLVNKSSRILVCHPNCIKYEKRICPSLKRFPFVCNYCKKKGFCKEIHVYYDPEYASNEYHLRINNANKKPKIKKETIKNVNKIVSPLVKKGQSIEAIKMNHPEINASCSTIRRWVKDRYLDCRLSEFRMNGRRVSKKYDYSSRPQHNVLLEAKLGHKYTNYLYYKQNHECLTIQLDSVIGTIDSKQVLLTIHIVEHKFQFGILLSNKSKDEVYNHLLSLLSKLKHLEVETGIPAFSFFTQCWLTDNGTEFDKILDLQKIYSNMNIFFCNPYSSFEKGACERNHILVRYVHYKGWTFDDLEQNDIDLLFSNINSYPRKALNEKTPYQSVVEDYRLGKEFLDLIGINKVNSDDVVLNPSLLKKFKK